LIPYTYVFVSLLAMLIAGNACYKLGRRNRSQLGYNVVVLALLCAAIYAMSGTAATYLGFANVNPFSIFLMLILTFGALPRNTQISRCSARSRWSAPIWWRPRARWWRYSSAWSASACPLCS